MTICPLCGHENPEGAEVCAACGHGSPEDAPPDDSPRSRWAKHTRRFLVVFYSLAVLDGFAVGAGWPNADLVFGLAAGLTVSWWVITDASDRDRPLRLVVRVFVMLFGAFSSFFYLIWSRRVRGFGWFLLNAAGYVGTILTVYVVIDAANQWVAVPEWRDVPALMPEGDVPPGGAEPPPLPAD